MLEPVADNIWAVATPHAFMGLHVGTRMTVVKLSGGGLLLHSPVPVDDALAAQLAELGEVTHIVCPNLFHHVFAGQVAERYPRALLHGPAKLARKRSDLSFGAILTDAPHPDWEQDFELLTIDGSLLNETVFYHRPSHTLIAADLIENFHQCDHGFTRWYLKLGGLLGKPGWHPILRLVYVNRRKARASLEQLLQWPFERLVLAHGEVIGADARQHVIEGMAWLRKR
ncbi:hypothetical protein A11A3_07153 [Alcanivorax hongdengensis A-11-3]|uniref:DUF4336 domain-containing protein n=1 Tax=Alcanivorax hongdengensis A-11-3 TaxID=1177179 RepID=L0WCV1_9GAMM|nr:DUF4336 domain-containing protein [Alcanivorax hongdengensis]EKF74781.1 hypothetical protein A11A3_07153 [Alcanivorax hongdengensis A-11-3]